VNFGHPAGLLVGSWACRFNRFRTKEMLTLDALRASIDREEKEKQPWLEISKN